MCPVDRLHALRGLRLDLCLKNECQALNGPFGADTLADARLSQHSGSIALAHRRAHRPFDSNTWLRLARRQGERTARDRMNIRFEQYGRIINLAHRISRGEHCRPTMRTHDLAHGRENVPGHMLCAYLHGSIPDIHAARRQLYGAHGACLDGDLCRFDLDLWRHRRTPHLKCNLVGG